MLFSKRGGIFRLFGFLLGLFGLVGAKPGNSFWGAYCKGFGKRGGPDYFAHWIGKEGISQSLKKFFFYRGLFFKGGVFWGGKINFGALGENFKGFIRLKKVPTPSGFRGGVV